MVCIIALVGDRCFSLKAVDEIMGKSDIVALSGAGDQTDWQPERIASGVDLRAQTAPRPAQTLGICPPFILRAPAAC